MKFPKPDMGLDLGLEFWVKGLGRGFRVRA